MRSIYFCSRWLCRPGLAFCFLAALWTVPPAASNEAQPDGMALVALLKDGRFAELETTIVDYQKRFEADHNAQWPVIIAFEAFADSDSALEPRLNQWVAAAPKSYVAPLARGVFYEHLGWLSRGNAYARQTAGQRFGEMRDFFAAAKEDLQRARARNPNLIQAYVSLASIARAAGDRSEMVRVLKAGLAIAPESVPLHSEFLSALQQKWFGEPGDIDRYVTALKNHFPGVAARGFFRGYADFAAAAILLDGGNDQEALTQFDRAVALGPRVPDFLWARAKALSNLHRYDEAAADLERAVAISPQDAEYHFSLAKVRSGQGRIPDALASFDRAIALDRLNPDFLYGRALMLHAVRRDHEALRDLDAAMTYGTYDTKIQDERNRALMRFEARFDDAVAASRREVELFPRHSMAWLLYAEALMLKQDCQAHDAMDMYHKVCTLDDGCEAENRDSLPTVLPYMHCGKF